MELREIYSASAGYNGSNPEGLEIDLNRLLLNTFTSGNFLYLVYDTATQNFEYVSEGVRDVLGVEPEEFDFQYFIENMHPDDFSLYMEYERLVTSFKTTISCQDQMNYKTRYDYRLRNAAGDYVRILHQVIVIQNDDTGFIRRTLGIFTDISYLKMEGEMTFAMIGLDGLPSYIGTEALKNRTESKNKLSSRELEILNLLSMDMSSQQIGEFLFISEHTVSNHRRNMLKKAKVKSTPELILKALKNCWM